MPALAGVRLAERLVADGWSCADGRHGPPNSGRWLYEVFPYTTLVGAAELGYEHERPVYKRKPRHLTPDEFRRLRADQLRRARRSGSTHCVTPTHRSTSARTR